MAMIPLAAVRHRQPGKGCLLVLVPALAAALYLARKAAR